MKDKKWLKEAVGELPCVDTVFNSGGSSYIDSAVPVMVVYDLIDQLDEPEVLSQEWIDKHKVARINNLRKMTMSDVVPVDDLQNLLIPKQGIAKVPQEWFDVIKRNKDMTLETILRIANPKREEEERFVKAWLAYPDIEVEEEQKYYVLDSEDIPLLERVGNHIQKTTTELSIYEKGRANTRFKLAEQEIKNYDERFWPFAEPVEVAE